MNAIADAIGDEIFRKSPVSPDIILEGARERRKADARSAHRAHLGEDTNMAVIRDIIPAFELYQPASVDDALKLLEQARRRRPGAGRRPRQHGLAEGSPQAAQGGGRPRARSRTLRGVQELNGGVEIGAMTPLTEVVQPSAGPREVLAC